MNAQSTALWAAILAGAFLASPFTRPAAESPVTLRIEADAVSAAEAMEKSAEAFTRQTGIQVVVEKFGYKASLAKATEDLASKDLRPRV
jgi:ABC-type glycerol-3-phosphate transport system substrate-binding protein